MPSNSGTTSGRVVDGSVIGEGVTVAHPIRITNSLVFPGTHVTETHDLDHVVIHGENIMQCDRASVGT
ncbi:MAG: hypothetical protein IPJ56_00440 [Gemmatimonadetes bacterium]|jgi:ADP-glucose pyrophosphorylase|nr:hypothetical protein [Gemmatimonadota bacterium]